MPAKKTAAVKKTAAKKTAKVNAKFTPQDCGEEVIECCEGKKYKTNKKRHKKQNMWSFYFLWFIGAAIYFIGAATSFGMGILGLLKALVRPVFLVHGLLKFLGL